MKKIASIITVLSIVTASALSAVTAAAAQTITADEVKKLICATGLIAYPELWDKTITELGKDEDVLNPETRTVKDVIDINSSYREYFTGDGENGFAEDATICFKGFNSNGDEVSINYFNDEITYMQNSFGEAEGTVLKDLECDYDKIAEIINSSDIDAVEDIKIVYPAHEFFVIPCIYVKDDGGNEFAISANGYDDRFAQRKGKEMKSLKKGEIMTFTEWNALAEEFSENAEGGLNEQFETVDGDEIRDTDTRAPYIGTESKFSDVSGDLVSYVNELCDLGIINGYEDGTFRPDNTITRGEAASMLARMLKYEGKYDGGFNDVNADDWFADDVAALAGNGIINGYDDVTFAPYNEIKYQEVMKILVCALGYPMNYFQAFGESAYPSMTTQKAMQIGLTDGLSGFDTTAAITRGDMAVMLSNALDTHMFTTVQMIPHNGVGGGMSKRDITLIDYLNGKKLNGTLPKARLD